MAKETIHPTGQVVRGILRKLTQPDSVYYLGMKTHGRFQAEGPPVKNEELATPLPGEVSAQRRASHIEGNEGIASGALMRWHSCNNGHHTFIPT